MKTNELYEILKQKYPEELSCEWDNDGLMCCTGAENEVGKILVTLDVTDKAVDEAVKGKYDVIISHHPLIFKPVYEMNGNGNVSRKLIKLIQNDISVMSFHTRLDAGDGGVNDVLAEILGLRNVEKFGGADEKIIGRMGYTEKTDLDSFACFVKKKLGAPFVLAAGNRNVKKVAVVGGDGKDYIKAAGKLGADTYVTGRAGYNVMAEAEETGINIIEAGHYFTENPVCEALKNLIVKICADSAGIEVSLFESNVIKSY